jgi:hypothetical protein
VKEIFIRVAPTRGWSSASSIGPDHMTRIVQDRKWPAELERVKSRGMFGASKRLDRKETDRHECQKEVKAS